MNTLDDLFNLLGTIVVLAGITVVITSNNTRGIINALASAFTGSIKAATMQG